MRAAVVRECKVERPARLLRRWLPPVPIVRSFPYWRRAERILFEHWIAAVILFLAIANAARLLASE